MDLLATIRKEGSRGGRANFKWDDVKDDQHRENYLGHSLMAPVGRWQKNKDLSWYAKADTPDGESEEQRQRAEEIRRIKEAEQDALSAALGFSVERRVAPAVSAKDVQKAIDESTGAVDGDNKDEVGGGRGVGFGGFRGNALAGRGALDEAESGLKPFTTGETGPIDMPRAGIDTGKRGQNRQLQESDRRASDRHRHHHHRHHDRDRDHRRRRSRDRPDQTRRRHDHSRSPSSERDERRRRHRHRARDEDDSNVDGRQHRPRVRLRSRSPRNRDPRRDRRDMSHSRSSDPEPAYPPKRDPRRRDSPARSDRLAHRAQERSGNDNRRHADRDRRYSDDDDDDAQRGSYHASYDRGRGNAHAHSRSSYPCHDGDRRRSRSRH